MISIAAITLSITVLTSFLKKWVYPTHGKLGVQVTTFLLASVGAIYVTYSNNFPDLEKFIGNALALFSLAVAMYEVLFQNIAWFKVNTPEVEEARDLEKWISKH